MCIYETRLRRGEGKGRRDTGRGEQDLFVERTLDYPKHAGRIVESCSRFHLQKGEGVGRMVKAGAGRQCTSIHEGRWWRTTDPTARTKPRQLTVARGTFHQTLTNPPPA